MDFKVNEECRLAGGSQERDGELDMKAGSAKDEVPYEDGLNGTKEGDEMAARRGECSASEAERGDEVQSQDRGEASIARMDGGDGEGCGWVTEVYPGRVFLAKRPREERISIETWCALFPRIVSEQHENNGRRGTHQALSGEEPREGAAEDEVQAGTAVF